MRSVPVFNRTEIAFLPGDGIAGAHTTVLDARHVYFAGEASLVDEARANVRNTPPPAGSLTARAKPRAPLSVRAGQGMWVHWGS